ncbi:MAG: hypothetical protein FD167_129 [bacterium]|nr:MAG: hypothetical protein FD167_129 [bacterium]
MKSIATYIVLAYGLLVIIGGVIGFVKAKSNASLIAGVVSGLLVLTSGFIMLSGIALGTYLALATTFILMGVFGVRLAKTKAFMPSGMLFILNDIVFILLVLSLVL